MQPQFIKETSQLIDGRMQVIHDDITVQTTFYSGMLLGIAIYAKSGKPLRPEQIEMLMNASKLLYSELSAPTAIQKAKAT